MMMKKIAAMLVMVAATAGAQAASNGAAVTDKGVSVQSVESAIKGKKSTVESPSTAKASAVGKEKEQLKAKANVKPPVSEQLEFDICYANCLG